MNPDKTEEKLLISSFACPQNLLIWNLLSPEKKVKKNVMDKRQQSGISFNPVFLSLERLTLKLHISSAKNLLTKY